MFKMIYSPNMLDFVYTFWEWPFSKLLRTCVQTHLP